MVAKRFEDLITWQLASQLQDEIFRITSTGPAARDRGFCDQIKDSSRSAVRNTAEGFGRYYPREFRWFLRIAAGSLQETKSHLHDGLSQRYFSSHQHSELIRLTLRAFKANIRLQRYLKTAKAPDPFAHAG